MAAGTYIYYDSDCLGVSLAATKTMDVYIYFLGYLKGYMDTLIRDISLFIKWIH